MTADMTARRVGRQCWPCVSAFTSIIPALRRSGDCVILAWIHSLFAP